MLYKDELKKLYKSHSSAEIAKIKRCSVGQVNYWLERYWIKKRSISEAIYKKHNPDGDPFSLHKPKNISEAILYGLGVGLYWGEGTKRGMGAVRLSNTDVKLLRKFVEFLETFFNIDKNKLRFSIQIFSDISGEEALNYWARELGVKKNQFYKTIVSKVRGEGTYKYKSKYGVAIVYFNNIKLKRLICNMIENIH